MFWPVTRQSEPCNRSTTLRTPGFVGPGLPIKTRAQRRGATSLVVSTAAPGSATERHGVEGQMSTIRMTMAQAIVRFLASQYVSRDGQEQRFFAGMWGIFGH